MSNGFKKAWLSLDQDPLLEEVLNHVFAFIGILNPDGTLLKANTAPLVAGGLDAKEVIGKKLWDCYWCTHCEKVGAIIQNACERAAQGESLRFDLVVRMAHDSRMPIDFQISPLRRPDGDIIYLVVSAVDITARKQKEVEVFERAQEVRESEERFRALAELSPDAMLVHAGGRFVFANASALELLGAAKAEDVVGGSGVHFIEPELREEVRQLAHKVKAAGTLRSIRQSLKRLDGSVVEVEGSAGAIDWHGKPALQVIWRDVSERTRAEEALRRSEATLSAVLDTLPVAVIIADQSGQFVRDNPLNRQLWGVPPETASWEQYRNWVGWWPETGKRIKAEEWGMARTLLHGEVIHNELILNERFDGNQRRYFLNNAAPLRDDQGQIIGGVVAQLDVTDRIAAEEALRQADRAKDEFLAILGHELRNPLAPLQTGLDLLQPGAPNPELLDRIVPMMRRQLSHLVRLVDDLLDISRISRGKIELQRDPVDLNAPAQAAVEQVRHLIDSRAHQLRLECSPDRVTVNGDFERLTQVVANLLSNAAKYTEPGGAITVTTWREFDQAHISVRDTGIGMAPDDLTKVFALFSQIAGHQGGDGSGGLGIGLALSRQLVEMHGGTVEATSEGIGRGSEFVIRLPISQVDREESSPGAQKIDRRSPARRVLVVDDNVDAAEGLRMLLEAQGQVVEVAYDGPSSLQTIEQFKPDVVLLDLGLPGMDGCEVARRIRLRPAGDTIRLVAVTGWGQDEDKARTQDAGFDDHLTKPVALEKLQSALASFDFG